MNPEITGTHRLVDKLAASAWLDGIADAIQPAIGSLLDSEGTFKTPLKNALHGTWLGHALHPMLTDIPIGAWAVAAVCDGLELVGMEGYGDAADIAIAIGSAAAFAAALTGWADWSDTRDDPKRLGIAHAALGGAALSAYLASLAMRAAGSRRAAAWTALAAYGVVSAGAYLGGELSTGMHLGTKHTSPALEPPNDFVAVCPEDDLPEGKMKRVDLAGIPVLIARTFGDVTAVAAVCTHRGGPLDEGTMEGSCVRCPWHGGLFDLRTGIVRDGPPTFPLATFEARVSGGRIELRRSN
jgi:nitrite reductase/ring-hydroxylating ferredoxin subunit/uncharacterized membrane protein